MTSFRLIYKANVCSRIIVEYFLGFVKGRRLEPRFWPKKSEIFALRQMWNNDLHCEIFCRQRERDSEPRTLASAKCHVFPCRFNQPPFRPRRNRENRLVFLRTRPHTKKEQHRKRGAVLFGRGRRTWTLGTRFWSGCRKKKNHPNSTVLRHLPLTKIVFDAVLMLFIFYFGKGQNMNRSKQRAHTSSKKKSQFESWLNQIGFKKHIFISC